MMRWQLWLWFIGMIVLTFPWHYVGILGMPRRMAYFDYTDPEIAAQAVSVILSVVGGALLVISAILFFIILISAHRGPRIVVETYRFSKAIHEAASLPVALNGFALWLTLMIALTLVNYGYPIAQLMALPQTSVPAVHIGGSGR
jgi:cytochrome c oxidase subunit 1